MVLPVWMVIISCFILETKCGYLEEDDKFCATLYSQNDTKRFRLKDWDHIGDLTRDFRSSKDGWKETTSLGVESNCDLILCDSLYFTGDCHTFSGNSSSEDITPDRYSVSNFIITSASCRCKKECSCKNLRIPKNDHTFGRLYLNGDCNSCNSTYLQLYTRNNGTTILPTYGRSVKSVVLREGCNVTTYEYKHYGGFWASVSTRFVKNFKREVGSYVVQCRQNTEPDIVNHRLLNLSMDYEYLLAMASNNEMVASYKGVRSALKSLETGRSHRNAYILFIGDDDVENLGIRGCQKYENKIGECYVRVNIEESNVTNSEIRIITVGIAKNTSSNSTWDARWIASLKEYLETHEELKYAFPNAVVVYHYGLTDETIAEEGSVFQRKLDVVTALRGYILDPNDSNLIFYLDHKELSDIQQIEESVEKFENVIDKRAFPKPTVFALRESGVFSTPKENGYHKMGNGEYWPKNLQEKLMVASKMGGDHLGSLIFKAAFPEENELKVVHKGFKDLLEWNDNKIKIFQLSQSNLNASCNMCGLWTKKPLFGKAIRSWKTAREKVISHENRFQMMTTSNREIFEQIKSNQKAVRELENTTKLVEKFLRQEKALKNKITALESVIEKMGATTTMELN